MTKATHKFDIKLKISFLLQVSKIAIAQGQVAETYSVSLQSQKKEDRARELEVQRTKQMNRQAQCKMPWGSNWDKIQEVSFNKTDMEQT